MHDYQILTASSYTYTLKAISEYKVYKAYSVYTPVTYMTVIANASWYRTTNNVGEPLASTSKMVVTTDNVTSIASVISAKWANQNSMDIQVPQNASDITVEHIRSLIPTAQRNNWMLRTGDNSYWNNKTGISTRKYNGSNTYTYFHVEFLDGYNYSNAYAGMGGTPTSLSYDRSFTANIVNTICLPFAIDNTAGTLGTFYTLDDTQTSGSTVAFKTVTITEANKPYLFVPSATGTLTLAASTAFSAAGAGSTTVGDFSLVGVQSATSINSDADNSIYAFKTDGSLIKITSATTLKGMRAYLKATGESKSRLLRISLDGDESTAISVVNSEVSKENVYYNLQGIRVSQPQKGLYIVNGKKVLVK